MSAHIVSARAVRGELRLKAARDERGQTVLAHRHAAGAFHLSKPYWNGSSLMVQWINPTAGIFAGDLLESDVWVGEGASLLLTTPSATRIHTRMDPSRPPGHQKQSFEVEAGGCLEVQSEWLMPQKMSSFGQQTELSLHEEAGLFYTELLAPGRVAHGEALVFDELTLALRVRVGGRLLLQERLSCDSSRTWMLRSSASEPLYFATVLVKTPEANQPARQSIYDWSTSLIDCSAGVTAVSDTLSAVRVTAASSSVMKHAIHSLRVAMAFWLPTLKANLRKL